MSWQAIIRDAVHRGWCRTGEILDFRLARRDLLALAGEIMERPIDADEWDGPGFVRIQARVYVPRFSLCVTVDEWPPAEPRP